MTKPNECFQCGRPIVHLMPDPPHTAETWLTCSHCGERTMTMAEFVSEMAANDEERIKRAIGFYDFKPSRR